MRRVIALCLLLVASALALSACSTVRSEREANFQLDRDNPGLTYFLPMRLVRLTATRAPLRLTELERARTSKREALAEATTAYNAAKDARERAQAVYDATPATASVRPAMLAELERARTTEGLAEDAKKAAQAELDAVQASLDAFLEGGAVCAYSAKLDLLSPQADLDQRFIARPTHNILRDDTANLAVSPAGLLSSANVIAVDHTGDIIVEAAGAIAGARSRGSIGAASVSVDCAGLPRQYVQIFNPIENWTIEGEGASRQVRLPVLDSVNAALASAQFPFRLRVNADALAPPATPSNRTTIANRMDGDAEDARWGGALYYRSPAPVIFSIEQRVGGTDTAPARTANSNASGQTTGYYTDAHWQPIDASVLMLPQAGPISYIPMNSAAFVRTVNDVTFVDGTIASWNSQRPSEALEIVRLPVRVLTAIISVPAQLVSLRVDYSSDQSDLAEMQTQQIEQDTRLRVLRTCLRNAGDDDEVALACFETE